MRLFCLHLTRKKKFNIVKEVFVHRLNEMTVYILEVVSTNPNSPGKNARMLEYNKIEGENRSRPKRLPDIQFAIVSTFQVDKPRHTLPRPASIPRCLHRVEMVVILCCATISVA